MSIEISAMLREKEGSVVSRRLRRSGKVPGVIYGAKKNAVSVEFDHHELFLSFRQESFHSSILSLNLNGKKEPVLLRDYQLHPVKNTLQHIDFQRVSATDKIHMKVPFHFLNAEAAPGVRLGGGIVAHVLTEVDISCLPRDLPEFIEVDLVNLELGRSLHLSDIPLPKGVEFVQLSHGNDAVVTSIAKPKAEKTGDEVEATEETES